MHLNEFRPRLNSHQTHLESLIFLGRDGIEEFNDKIVKLISMMKRESKELNITAKIDGSPAVAIYGRLGKEGYPDYGVCLKSFTTTSANVLTTAEEIENRYGSKPGLASKLKYCLELTHSIPDGEAWQGDCLFDKSSKIEQEIKGTRYLTFQPNKIVYAISEDNPGYNKIKSSKFGICFHTCYKPSGEGFSQSFNVDASRLVNVPNDIYVMSPELNYKDVLNSEDVSSYEDMFNELKTLENKLLNDSRYEELVNNELFMKYWNTYENSRLADNKQVNINVNELINDLSRYIKEKRTLEYNKKIASLKTDIGKEKATSIYNKEIEDLINLINNNKDLLVNIVNAFNLAANIKMKIWNTLKDIKQDYKTFYNSASKGFINANMEGISVSDKDGNIVKVVDRSSFSNANRDPDILSGFVRESLKKATAYMLRNDGKLIACKSYHPYILGIYKNKEDDVESLFMERLWELKWFYDNTNNESTRDLISIVYKSKTGNTDKFNANEDTYTTKDDNELNEFLKQLNNEVNQEFCRVRTSDLKYGGDSDDLYIRISSIGFNWFNIIWDLVYKNKDISTITISRDLKANNFSKGEVYKVNGESINHMTRDEFITLKGNPVIENYKFDRSFMNESLSNLNKGLSISKSLPESHPRHLNDIYEGIKNKQLNNDMNIITEGNKLSRLLTHLKDNVNFAIIGSLDKDDYTVSHFNELYNEMSRLSTKYKFSWKHTIGRYTMENTGETIDEDSLIIYNIPKNIAIQLGKKFNQESIIYKDDDFFGFIYMNGREENCFNRDGIITSPNHVKDFSTRFAKKHDFNKAFKFEFIECVLPTGKGWYYTDKDIKYNTVLEEDFRLHEDVSNHVVLNFGRMNPPTLGHELLVNKIKEIANNVGGEPRLYLSHSQDPKKNPLTYPKKLYWCRKSFGNIVTESDANNMYTVLSNLYNEGIKHVTYICGSDRIGEAERIKKYNGAPDRSGKLLFDFETLDIIQVGEDRIEEDINMSKVSASNQRRLAEEGNFEEFKLGCPSTLTDDERFRLYVAVRAGMGIEDDEFLRESVEDRFKDGSITVGGNKYLIKTSTSGKFRFDCALSNNRFYDRMREIFKGDIVLNIPSLGIDDLNINENSYIVIQGKTSTSGEKRGQLKIDLDDYILSIDGVKGAAAGKEAEEKSIDDDIANKFTQFILEDVKNNKHAEEVDLPSNITSIEYIKGVFLNHQPKINTSWDSLFNRLINWSDDINKDIADTCYEFKINGEYKDVYASVKDGKTSALINLGLANLSTENILDAFIIDKSCKLYKLASSVVDRINTKAEYDKNDNWYYTDIDQMNYDIEAIKRFTINSYRKGYYFIRFSSGSASFENVCDVRPNMDDSFIFYDATVTHSTVYVQYSFNNIDYALNIRRRSANGGCTAELRVNTRVNNRKGRLI